MKLNNIEYKPLKEYLKDIKLNDYELQRVLTTIMNVENVSRKKKTEFLIFSIDDVLYSSADITQAIEETYQRLKNYNSI